MYPRYGVALTPERSSVMSCHKETGVENASRCDLKPYQRWLRLCMHFIERATHRSDNPLPKGLASLLEDKYHPQAMGTPHDVAFPMEPGLYLLCYKTTIGEDLYVATCLGPNYTRLERFIKSAAASGYKTHTIFGSGRSYFSTSPSGYSWQNLTPALEEVIQHGMRTRRPMTVALGVDVHVVLNEDGSVTANLRGQYPLVEALITDGKRLRVGADLCRGIPRGLQQWDYDAAASNSMERGRYDASVVEKYELAPAAQAPAAPAATPEPPPAAKSGHSHKIWTGVHKISESNDKINWTEVEKSLEVGVKVVGDLAHIAHIVKPESGPAMLSGST
ncbi:hypothetical protein C8R44DRAFT_725064 [Mycena epipterygia]|nr:hypothetical protein C8R44DRAFT_725064 [Mycena epipterygia]